MSAEPKSPPAWGVLAFGVYLVGLNLLLIYLLLALWPQRLPISENSATAVLFGRVPLTLGVERVYLILAAVSGALGSYIHLATSFADYLGNRQFKESWTWWYILRPFIGTTLAVIVYFALRGGLIMGSSSADTLSPYGVAAVSGLAGMFSKQATDKLREVFEGLFATKEASQRKDPLVKDT